MKKRLPTLVLSLLLCLSLAVPVSAAEEVSDHADPTAFTDAAQITDWEAVAALTQLGVIHGKGNGAFDPTAPVTRAEAATLLAQMLCGGRLPQQSESQYDHTFSDIETHWGRGAIQVAAGLGLIDGRGDGTFDPEGTVTLLELNKMALATLGYDPENYGLTGENWAERTDQMSRINGLYTGLQGVVLQAPVSREVAARVLYNILDEQVIYVKYDNAYDGGISIDGMWKAGWRFMPKTDENGQPVSFLKDRFQLTEIGDLPAQPME